MLSPTTRIIHPRPGSLSHPYTPVALNILALARRSLVAKSITSYLRLSVTTTFSLSLSPTLLIVRLKFRETLEEKKGMRERIECIK